MMQDDDAKGKDCSHNACEEYHDERTHTACAAGGAIILAAAVVATVVAAIVAATIAATVATTVASMLRRWCLDPRPLHYHCRRPWAIYPLFFRRAGLLPLPWLHGFRWSMFGILSRVVLAARLEAVPTV